MTKNEKRCVVCNKNLNIKKIYFNRVSKIELIEKLNKYKSNCAEVGCYACKRCLLAAREASKSTIMYIFNIIS